MGLVTLVPVMSLCRADPTTPHLLASDCTTLLSLVLTQNVASECCFITGRPHPQIDLIARLAHHPTNYVDISDFLSCSVTGSTIREPIRIL